jgi:hypothetical protein
MQPDSAVTMRGFIVFRTPLDPFYRPTWDQISVHAANDNRKTITVSLTRLAQPGVACRIPLA